MTENEAYELYVVTEPCVYFYKDYYYFNGMDLKIEFRNSIVEEHPIIKTLKEELNSNILIFIEIENELLRIDDYPYIDDYEITEYNFKRFGPFSSEEILIDFIKNIKSIPFNDDRIYKDCEEFDDEDDDSWELGDYEEL